MGVPTAGHQGAKITFASGYVLHAFSFTINREVTPIEVTEFLQTERTRISGLGDSNGTFSCIQDSTTAIPALPHQGTAEFYSYDSGGNTRKETIQIMVNSFSKAVNIDGRIEITFNWVQAGVGSSSDFVSS